MLNLLQNTLKAALLTGCCAALLNTAAGQAKAPGSSDLSKIDIYGGYGLWDAIDSDIYGKYYPKLYNPNATVSVTYWFTRHIGFTVEGEYFSRGRTLNAAGACNAIPCSPVGQRVYTAEGGFAYRQPFGRWIPYTHVLGGAARISGPYLNPLTLGWGVKGGIGVDYVLPYFHGLIALKPAEADFEYDQVSYGPLVLPAAAVGGFADITVAKVSSGLVLRLGGGYIEKAHNELMLGCDVSPATVYPGEPVQVSANPMNLKAKKKALYMFRTTGGRVVPGDRGATIATDGLAPGDYQIKGSVTEGSRANEQAKCEGSFSVKAYEPPTISCSADPATVQAGGVATVTAVASSPSNRTLSYSFSSDSGTLTGTGNKVELATTSTSGATIHVTCNVVDDLGKTATATTQVGTLATAKATAPPPLPEASTLCSVSFERDLRRPVRVDNEAKACLDDIALNLQRQPDAKLVVIGNFGLKEGERQGAERSLNVKQYLTDEKGIDAGRIDTRVGAAGGRSVDDLLVPPGATFDQFKGKSFDPASVKRVGQAYGKPGQHIAGTRHRVRRGTHRAVVHRRARVRHRRAAGRAGAAEFTAPSTAPPTAPPAR
jgi:hypothetical protein